jgi:hypothetical protein
LGSFLTPTFFHLFTYFIFGVWVAGPERSFGTEHSNGKGIEKAMDGRTERMQRMGKRLCNHALLFVVEQSTARKERKKGPALGTNAKITGSFRCAVNGPSHRLHRNAERRAGGLEKK